MIVPANLAVMHVKGRHCRRMSCHTYVALPTARAAPQLLCLFTDLCIFTVFFALSQIYREKIKAAVEGRPFNAPPPSTVQVNLGSSSSSSSARPGSRPGSAGAGSNGSRQAAGGHDEWGDWGDKPAAANGGAGGASGFSSNSEYSRSQYMASAANKEEFFSRKMQENNSKPDHLPPSQGGKYVGFGSTPAPRPPSGMQAGAGGVDDVTALLSKGLASLGQVAGVAATTATTVVQSGTQNINQLLQEKQVGQTLQQTSKVVAEKAQVGAAETWFRLLLLPVAHAVAS